MRGGKLAPGWIVGQNELSAGGVNAMRVDMAVLCGGRGAQPLPGCWAAHRPCLSAGGEGACGGAARDQRGRSTARLKAEGWECRGAARRSCCPLPAREDSLIKHS